MSKFENSNDIDDNNNNYNNNDNNNNSNNNNKNNNDHNNNTTALIFTMNAAGTMTGRSNNSCTVFNAITIIIKTAKIKYKKIINVVKMNVFTK